VQTEADDQWQSQGELPAGGRLPDGQALGEVVQADTYGNQQRDPAGGGPGGHPARASSRDLANAHGSRAAIARTRRGRLRPDERSHNTALVVHKRQQPDGQTCREEGAVAEGHLEPALAVVC